MSSWHINGTETSLSVSYNLCAEHSLGLGNEPGLSCLCYCVHLILYLGSGHSVRYKLCAHHSVDLSSSNFDNPGNINSLCSEVGTGDEYLRELGSWDDLSLHLDLRTGDNSVGAVCGCSSSSSHKSPSNSTAR